MKNETTKRIITSLSISMLFVMSVTLFDILVKHLQVSDLNLRDSVSVLIMVFGVMYFGLTAFAAAKTKYSYRDLIVPSLIAGAGMSLTMLLAWVVATNGAWIGVGVGDVLLDRMIGVAADVVFDSILVFGGLSAHLAWRQRKSEVAEA